MNIRAFSRVWQRLKTGYRVITRPKLTKFGIGLAAVSIIVIAIVSLQNTKAVQIGDGKVAYGENTALKVRDWTGSWPTSSEATVSAVDLSATGGAKNVNMEAAPTRNEMLMGVQAGDGSLNMLRWNGTSWILEWSFAAGGVNLARFDIAYEKQSGDALVAYSANTGTTNEIRYKIWNGTSWLPSAAGYYEYDAIRTSGTVDALVLESQPSSNNIGMAWGDTNMHLSANLWDGDNNIWKSEPSAVLTTTLADDDTTTTNLTNWSFDIAFESISGEMMAIWGNDGSNDPRYMMRSPGANGSWSGTTTTAAALAEEALDMDVTSDPNSDYIAYVNSTNNGNDADCGIWDGSNWIATSNFDTTLNPVVTGSKNNAITWLKSGDQTRALLTYDDSANFGIEFKVFNKNTGLWEANAQDANETPAPTSADNHMHRLYTNPHNQTMATSLVVDNNNDLIMKRFVFDGTNVNYEAGELLETTLPYGSIGADFAYNIYIPSIPVTQSAYRWFNNTASGGSSSVGPVVGSALAAQDAAATMPSNGQFRLRVNIGTNSSQALPVGSGVYRLQFAARGADNSCDAAGTNETYADVSSNTAIKFYDNTNTDDDLPLTASVSDPVRSGITAVNQTYEESNPFTNTQSIAVNQDGRWDFSLAAGPDVITGTYCLRVVNEDGSVLNDYSVMPEISITDQRVQAAYRLFEDSDTLGSSSTFAKAYSSSGSVIDNGEAIANTSDGGFIVAGTSLAGVGSSKDATVVKYDSSGGLSWSKTIGTSGVEEAKDIIQTSDGGYALVGSYNANGGNAFLAKLDSSGALSWIQVFGGSGSDVAHAVKQTSDGGFVVVGEYDISAVNAFVAKYDGSGVLSWMRSFGTAAAVEKAYDVIQTSDGGYALVGVYGTNSGDAFIAKYDSTGTLSWTRTFGGSGEDVAKSVYQTTDGGYIIAGKYSANSGDAFVAKYSDVGAEAWIRTFGSSGVDEANAILQTSDDGFVVSGSYGANLGDAFMAKYDSSRNLSWLRTFGGSQADSSADLAAVSDGFVTTGLYDGDILLVRSSDNGAIDGCGTLCTKVEPSTSTPSLTTASPSPTSSSFTPSSTSPSPTIASISLSITNLSVPLGPQVGSPIAATNVAGTVPSAGTPFRLRVGLGVAGGAVLTSDQYKLQVAARGGDSSCDAAASGETYVDVSTSTAVKLYNKAGVSDDLTYTPSIYDPIATGWNGVPQYYKESSPFVPLTVLKSSQMGLWDFALTLDSSASVGAHYCIRIVNNSGLALNDYMSVAEIVTPGGSNPTGPALYQQLRGGQAVVDGVKSPFSW